GQADARRRQCADSPNSVIPLLEFCHHIGGEKLQGTKGFLVRRAAEIDLHRRLDRAEGVDAAADLSRHVLAKSRFLRTDGRLRPMVQMDCAPARTPYITPLYS